MFQRHFDDLLLDGLRHTVPSTLRSRLLILQRCFTEAPPQPSTLLSLLDQQETLSEPLMFPRLAEMSFFADEMQGYLAAFPEFLQIESQDFYELIARSCSLHDTCHQRLARLAQKAGRTSLSRHDLVLALTIAKHVSDLDPGVASPLVAAIDSYRNPDRELAAVAAPFLARAGDIEAADAWFRRLASQIVDHNEFVPVRSSPFGGPPRISVTLSSMLSTIRDVMPADRARALALDTLAIARRADKTEIGDDLYDALVLANATKFAETDSAVSFAQPLLVSDLDIENSDLDPGSVRALEPVRARRSDGDTRGALTILESMMRMSSGGLGDQADTQTSGQPQSARQLDIMRSLLNMYGLRGGEEGNSSSVRQGEDASETIVTKKDRLFPAESGSEWLSIVAENGLDWMKDSAFDRNKATELTLLVAWQMGMAGDTAMARQIVVDSGDAMIASPDVYVANSWRALVNMADYFDVSLPDQVNVYVGEKEILNGLEQAALLRRLARAEDRQTAWQTAWVFAGLTDKYDVLKELYELAQDLGTPAQRSAIWERLSRQEEAKAQLDQ